MNKLLWLGVLTRFASILALGLSFFTYYAEMLDTSLLCLAVSLFAWMVGSFFFTVYEQILIRKLAKTTLVLTEEVKEKAPPLDPERFEKVQSHPLFVKKEDTHE